MTEPSIFQSPIYTYGVIPLLIFLARVCDVSIGTVRIMLLSRGKRILPPLLAFIEILIWLLAIRQIFDHLDNVVCYIAYAGGFALGNYVGILIEHKLAVGMEVVRVITKQDAASLIECLKEEGYGVTSVDAQGTTGKVNVIYTIINRCDHKHVINMIHQFNPRAFYSVEDIKAVKEGVFPCRDENGAVIPQDQKRK
ncbi:MAG: DUF2179 domain-containing protein [Candidatus Omnitrophota bacterium]